MDFMASWPLVWAWILTNENWIWGGFVASLFALSWLVSLRPYYDRFGGRRGRI